MSTPWPLLAAPPSSSSAALWHRAEERREEREAVGRQPHVHLRVMVGRRLVDQAARHGRVVGRLGLERSEQRRQLAQQRRHLGRGALAADESGEPAEQPRELGEHGLFARPREGGDAVLLLLREHLLSRPNPA